jgi:hypothetical protein
VLRTFVINVRKWGKNHWQIVSDDVLGGAWIQHEGSGYRPNEDTVAFYLWFTSTDYANNFSARCTVDGTPLPQDLSMGSNELIDIEATDAKEQTHHFRKVKLTASFHWGKHPRADEESRKLDGFMLIDHPGAWECRLRRDGKTVRELRFTVTAEGMIANDEMQSGKNPVPLAPHTVFIDNRIGKDASSFDERLDPTAYKKSLQYGLPWPDHPKVKTIHAALPAKFGPSL